MKVEMKPFLSVRATVFAALFTSALVLSGVGVYTQAQQRELYVSVTDKSGKPVTGLQVSDFVVREDNLAREVLRVGPADEPMQIALLVDNTQEAEQDITYIRDAFTGFVREMGGNNSFSLVTIAERPTLVVNTTTNPEEVIKRGTSRLFSMPASGSYLLDAIIEATKGFEKQEAQRPVIVATTVEGVEFSSAHDQQVIDALKKTGASLYVVSTRPPNTSAFDSIEIRSRNIVFDRGTTESGGRHETVLTAMSLPNELKQLASVLKNQYVVVYARPETLIPPERVKVETTRSGLDARGVPVTTRRGA